MLNIYFMEIIIWSSSEMQQMSESDWFYLNVWHKLNLTQSVTKGNPVY